MEKKKRTLVKVTKVPVSIPSSPSTSTSSAPDSPAHGSKSVSSFSRHDPSDSRTGSSNPEPEPLALAVIDKPTIKKLGMSHD